MGFVSVDTQRVLALLCVAPHCNTDMEEPPSDMEDRFLEKGQIWVSERGETVLQGTDWKSETEQIYE